MIFEYKKTKLNNKQKEVIEDLICGFCGIHNINLNKITIDFRKTKNNYTSKGLFGGFIDMYNQSANELYYNPYNFIEFIDETNLYNIAHLAMHELVHTKQIQETEMIIVHPNILSWKGVFYNRAPFVVDIFNEIRQFNGKLAERYHSTVLPWEKDAYRLAEDFMGQPLYKTY